MATQLELLAWLNAAETAYNQLMIDGAVRVTVDQNGERVEFTAANADRLSKYIYLLRQQLGLVGRSRPAGVIF